MRRPLELTSVFQGRRNYLSDPDGGVYRAFVLVSCIIGESPLATNAVLDTGAEWCVIGRSDAESAGFDVGDLAGGHYLSSRFGILRGEIQRCRVKTP